MKREDAQRQIGILRRLDRELAASAASIQEAAVANRVQIAMLEAMLDDGAAEPTQPRVAQPRIAQRRARLDREKVEAPPRAGGDGAADGSLEWARLSPARCLMLDALDEAGVSGLSGRDLTSRIVGAGFVLDTCEKAKARLKERGLVTHDFRGRHWWAAGLGPENLEADRSARRHAKEE